MKCKLFAALTVMALLFVGFASIIFPCETDAADSFSITDDSGRVLTFSEPYKYIATLGLAYTSTIVEIGCESKLILIDSGSVGVVSKSYLGKTVNVSNYSDVAQALDTIVVEKNIEKSEILVVTYSWVSAEKVTLLSNAGYDNILRFYPKSYDNIVDYVVKMELAVGADKTVSSNMIGVASGITDKMKDYTGTPVKAIYVSYSKATKPEISNKNSIAVSMFEKCGAINSGYDADELNSYEPDGGIGKFLSIKIDEGTSVIFIDGNYQGSVADFVKDNSLTGKNVKVYKLEKTWNSYTPDAAEGLTYMSKCLYPSVFGSVDEDAGEPFNYTIAIVVVVVVVLVASVAFMVLRKSH